jgi:transposase-like protein
MPPCPLLTLPSSVVVLVSWLVSGPHRSLRWRRTDEFLQSCLRKWLAQADADERGSETRLTSAQKQELVQLRRDKRRLELEVEILKRAAAYFARENMPPN